MDVASDNLPDDVETLRAMLLAERARPSAAEALQAELIAQREENKALQAERIRLGVRIPRHRGHGFHGNVGTISTG
jgi:hypothetical protein